MSVEEFNFDAAALYTFDFGYVKEVELGDDVSRRKLVGEYEINRIIR